MSLGWIWLIGAVVLAALEVVLPGFILLGFAIGAAVVGLILVIGGPVAWLAASVPGMVLVFALVSLGAWLALRRWAGGSIVPAKTFDHDINENPPKGDQAQD